MVRIVTCSLAAGCASARLEGLRLRYNAHPGLATRALFDPSWYVFKLGTRFDTSALHRSRPLTGLCLGLPDDLPRLRGNHRAPRLSPLLSIPN